MDPGVTEHPLTKPIHFHWISLMIGLAAKRIRLGYINRSYQYSVACRCATFCMLNTTHFITYMLYTLLYITQALQPDVSRKQPIPEEGKQQEPKQSHTDYGEVEIKTKHSTVRGRTPSPFSCITTSLYSFIQNM